MGASAERARAIEAPSCRSKLPAPPRPMNSRARRMGALLLGSRRRKPRPRPRPPTLADRSASVFGRVAQRAVDSRARLRGAGEQAGCRLDSSGLGAGSGCRSGAATSHTVGRRFGAAVCLLCAAAAAAAAEAAAARRKRQAPLVGGSPKPLTRRPQSAPRAKPAAN